MVSRDSNDYYNVGLPPVRRHEDIEIALINSTSTRKPSGMECMVEKRKRELAELGDELKASKKGNDALKEELEHVRAIFQREIARWEDERAELRQGLGKVIETQKQMEADRVKERADNKKWRENQDDEMRDLQKKHEREMEELKKAMEEGVNGNARKLGSKEGYERRMLEEGMRLVEEDQKTLTTRSRTTLVGNDDHASAVTVTDAMPEKVQGNADAHLQSMDQEWNLQWYGEAIKATVNRGLEKGCNGEQQHEEAMRLAVDRALGKERDKERELRLHEEAMRLAVDRTLERERDKEQELRLHEEAMRLAVDRALGKERDKERELRQHEDAMKLAVDRALEKKRDKEQELRLHENAMRLAVDRALEKKRDKERELRLHEEAMKLAVDRALKKERDKERGL